MARHGNVSNTGSDHFVFTNDFEDGSVIMLGERTVAGRALAVRADLLFTRLARADADRSAASGARSENEGTEVSVYAAAAV
jgi:hypothetical protein